MGISVETLDDGLERFLSSSVPNGQFNWIILINFNPFGSKLNSFIDPTCTNGHIIIFIKLILGVSDQQTAFTCCRITHHNELEGLFTQPNSFFIIHLQYYWYNHSHLFIFLLKYGLYLGHFSHSNRLCTQCGLSGGHIAMLSPYPISSRVVHLFFK